jgi:hypothetical protein
MSLAYSTRTGNLPQRHLDQPTAPQFAGKRGVRAGWRKSKDPAASVSYAASRPLTGLIFSSSFPIRLFAVRMSNSFCKFNHN